jgi:acyl-CoA reductase-like NAD-dependent aldehyde dehydrogenase/uncharacterized protein (DUF2141 family)
MTPQLAAQTIGRARAAQSGWAALSVSRRSAVLGHIRREIASRCKHIAATIAGETSKPALDALAGDVLVTLEHLRYYETNAPRIMGPRRIGKPSFFFRAANFECHFEPHGVALIFGPSNYPFQLSMIPLMTALVTGNAVVLKCSERTPETATLIRSICAKAGVPDGLVQILHDHPESSSALIEAHPDLIFFTGSSHNGQQVAERAAKHLIPTILELGGKDAGIVFADCHIQRAVEGVTYGAFSNAGRVCVAVKRVYVEATIYEEFLLRLKRRVAKLRVSHEADADFCPLPLHARSNLRAQLEDALSRGARLLWPLNSSAIADQPVLLTNVPAEARILAEESFGPALCIAPFANEAEAIALANASPFALSSSVWTKDRSRGRRVAAALCAGSCAINDVIRTIANPHAPFGGNRLSGYGRYHGPDGLRAFSRTKTIMFASDRRKHEVAWFPFNSRTHDQLAGVLRFRHRGPGLTLRLRHLLLLLFVLAIFFTAYAATNHAETRLTIDVHLTKHAHGELAYLIFTSPAGFPADRNQAIRHGFLPIPGGAQQLRIETDLPPGIYAASLYEDLNGNRKLDRNLIGIPNEPVGASGNPKERFGPPRFDECSFQLTGSSQTIAITVVHGS